MREVNRQEYIDWLDRHRNNQLVKIITGIRRSGKSYLLFTLYKRHLVQQGIPEDHIIALALDDFGNRQYLDAQSLYNYVNQRIIDKKTYFILLDEIQLVEGFEAVLNGFLHIPNVDVYVTGSNSKFLSSDIVTEFRGRGDEIRVYPFTYAEVSQIIDDKTRLFGQYSRFGGMPLVWQMETREERETYLKQLFNQVYLSDIINRYNVRGKDELSELTDVLASSIGSLTNPARLANTFLSEKKTKLSQFTISSYINYLIDSFLVQRANRYDIKGRHYIGTPMKYYFVDIGLRNARLNFRQQEEGHLMENIIYNELVSRRFSVDVGMVQVNAKNKDGKNVRKQLEVDFVVNKSDQRYYIQSAYELGTDEKWQQEELSLRNIDDSFKRIIIQRNAIEPWHNERGVLCIGIEDFLMNKNSLNF